ncbi:hypothetical protein ORV05_13090 [Amycolatopsis cynarae]|uniref:Uncharacterized protein n=1 Tax=Amycolatopsis cynarae TaxID=2995223 RepID=A0ABY7B8J8_9PSEU|nr:hypothetical protein [Amycolatopsis sp. HUAS 11-8]WAL68666.1 hypothetical protein ORV05_13090 [Amycolatopsis sp. HUAS 11-8]
MKSLIARWLRFVLFLLLYVSALVFFFRFGADDFAGALTFGGKFTGALLVLAGAFLLVATIGLIDHGLVVLLGKEEKFPSSGLLALGGAVLISAAGACMILAQIGGGDTWKEFRILWGMDLPLLSAWSLYIALSAWVVHYLHRTGVHFPAFRENKGIALATIITILVTVANFGYSQIYQPYSHPQTVQIIAWFGEPVLSPDKASYEIPINLDTGNIGDSSVYVLDGYYFLSSQRADFTPGKEIGKQEEELANGAPFTRYSLQSGLTNIISGRYLVPGTFLNPGEHAKNTFVAQFPSNLGTGKMILEAYAIVGRKDRFTPRGSSLEYSWKESERDDSMTAIPPPHVTEDGSVSGQGSQNETYVRTRTGLRENNAIWELIRKPRFLNVWWQIEPTVEFVFTVQPEAKETYLNSRKTLLDTINRYGIFMAHTGNVEIPIPNSR